MDRAPAAAPGVRVIGTGLGRTGTNSFKLAMEILYPPQKCYHMKEVIENGGGRGWFPFWTRVFEGGVSVAELHEHLAPYAATCDYPSCLAWKQQLEAFPDAKIVHTTRSPESWAKSVMDTIFKLNPDNPNQPLGVKLLQLLFPFKVGRPFARLMPVLFRGHLRDGDKRYAHDELVAAFKEWEASVVASVPKDKLLIFRAEQGWEPLCKFLGVPVPNVPYPRVNDSAEFARIVSACTALGWITAATYVAAIAYAVQRFR